ncbi:MAG: hypothetical protein RL136_1580 [Planctomycetota bacterium]|jgi:prepilin-type N-terminal cleavage/methylation domain-containing protein
MHRTPRHTVSARRRGFTLIELLAVIAIIVILASLVLAVSSSVARASEERSTKATLEVLNLATEEFERTVDRKVSYRTGTVTGGVTSDLAPSAANPVRYDVDTNPAVPTGFGVTSWNNLAQPYSSIAAGLPGYSFLPFRRTASFLATMTETPSCATIMQKIPDSWFRGIKPNANVNSFTAMRHCVDAWDTPIIAVFPGREATSAELAANNPNIIDADGTIKCDSEWGSVTGTTSQGAMRVSCKDRRILWMSAGNDSRFTQGAGTNASLSTDNLTSYEP